jgi:hypothetical protein
MEEKIFMKKILIKTTLNYPRKGEIWEAFV